MANFYDKASLVLIPSGTKESLVFSQKPTNGDGDFTFSRSTSATRVGPSGYIEKETQNLLLQSNTFDTTWINYNTTRTSGQSGYDGSSDAWLFEKSAANGRIVQTLSQSGVQTFSVYAKANSLNWLKLQVYDGSSLYYTHFDLANGVLGSGSGLIDSSIISVGGGWYRCSISINISNQLVYIYPADGNNDTSGTSGSIYIQDAQLEQGLVARDYIETTTTAVYGGITDNIPRLDYTDSSCPSLLLEPQRNNLLENSEYFGGWSNNSYDAITPNATTSPEGISNAYLIETSTTNKGIYRIPSTTLTSGDKLTASIFLKEKSGSGSSIINFGTAATAFGGDTYSRFDLSDGTIDYANPNHDSVSIEDYGNGWYRCIITDTAVASGAFAIVVYSYGTNCDWYVYGAQAEIGSYATSYIPTYGAAVTRNEDVCNNAGNSDLFNDSEGVLYAEIQQLQMASGSYLALSDGTTNNRLIIGVESNGFRVYRNSSSILGSILASDLLYNKFAVKYNASETDIYVNGLKLVDSSIAPAMTGLDRINFTSGGATQKLYGKTKQILYFPTALTDEELATLTTI